MHGGRAGRVGKRGQGCFLFSQLIDSQMSGGVGCAAVPKHPVTSPETNTTSMHTNAKIAHAPALVHARVPVAFPVCLAQTDLFSKQIPPPCRERGHISLLQNKSQRLIMTLTCKASRTVA